MNWKIHHKTETTSTNLDARAGSHGDVFTADFQTAGRGRLDHKWLSAPGENLMMSVVLAVGDCPPEKVATLPLVVGLSVAEALSGILAGTVPNVQGTVPIGLKWPNDVLYDGKKLAGILCERNGDCVIAGIGVNVNQRKFAKEIENRAISLTQIGVYPQNGGDCPQGLAGTVPRVREAVLGSVEANYEKWMRDGFGVLLPSIAKIDVLKGREVSVAQTDSDAAPATGICGGIAEDGSLLVGDTRIYAGEAHVTSSTRRI